MTIVPTDGDTAATIATYKNLFRKTVASVSMENPESDAHCAALANAAIGMGVPDEIMTFPLSHPLRKGLLALDLIKTLQESQTALELVPLTLELLWRTVVWGFLREAYDGEEFAHFLSHFCYRDKKVRQLLEKSFVDQIKRFKPLEGICPRRYETFFRECPLPINENYPGVKVVLQQYARDYPSDLVKRLKVPATS